MLTSDEGLHFWAQMTLADGTEATRETTNRKELLAWIATHREVGGELFELGMTARGQALQNLLLALTFGAERIDILPEDQYPTTVDCDCRNPRCGHKASMHVGADGRCIVDGCVSADQEAGHDDGRRGVDPRGRGRARAL